IVDASEGATRVTLETLAGLRTGKAIVIVSDAKSRTNKSAIDVMIHFHGDGVGNFEKSNANPKDAAETRTNDLFVAQIPQQVAASGRAMVAILPQLFATPGA